MSGSGERGSNVASRKPADYLSRSVYVKYSDELVAPEPGHNEADTTEDISVTIAKQELLSYNTKSVSVLIDKNLMPAKFHYSDSDEKVPDEEHCGQVGSSMLPVADMFDIETMDTWKSLSEEGKDKLFVLMYTGKLIWKKVKFCPVPASEKDDQGTRETAEKGPWEVLLYRPDPNHDWHSSLEKYGTKTSKGTEQDTVLKYLMRGKSEEHLWKLLYGLQVMDIPFPMEDLWEMGLTAGMTNGCARRVVISMVDRLIGLLDGLTLPGFPKFWIQNITSSVSSDSFTVHSGPESTVKKSGSDMMSPTANKSSTADSSSCQVKPKKRKLEIDEHKSGKGKSGTGMTQKLIKAVRRGICGERSRVDLNVFMYYTGPSPNPSGRSSYYALLVEIHSKGKTEPQAKSEFTQEMIFALQNQCFVFGLFFSASTVTLYKAERKCSVLPADGKITFQFQEFSLVERGWTAINEAYFNVAGYQEMVLAIFTALIHAGKNFCKM